MTASQRADKLAELNLLPLVGDTVDLEADFSQLNNPRNSQSKPFVKLLLPN